MGYNQSGLIVTDTQNFPDDYLAGEALIQYWYTNLTACGWTAEKIMAHSRLIVPLGIVAGDKVVVGGFTFTFVNSGDVPFAVHIQATTLETLENLGNHTRDDIEWEDFTVGVMDIGILTNIPYIEWNVPDYPDPPDPTFDGNLEAMQIIPGAALGFFDFNPTTTPGGPGYGRSWGGGFLFTSVPHLFGGTISIKIQTAGGGGLNDVVIKSGDDVAEFGGLTVPQTWRIIANPHQFLLLVSGVLTARSFVLCSSLYPYGTATQANFIAGPQVVNPGGANRLDLNGIGAAYYVNMGSPYFALASVNTAQIPNLVFPGWGFGISVTEKLSNRIAGLDIKRDNSKRIPFEAFVAACVTEPTTGPIGSDKIYILGSLWDSFITTIEATIDSIEDVNGHPAYVAMYQDGDQDTSKGALLVQLSVL